MAIIYLLSLGHPINSDTKGEPESAVVIMSKLTRRSVRALQYDYYAHKETILQDRDALIRGELELARLRSISEFKQESRRVQAVRRRNNS